MRRIAQIAAAGITGALASCYAHPDIMLIMRYAVVPLGHAQPPVLTPVRFLMLLVAHVVFFGIPVALVVSLTTRKPAILSA